MSTLLHALLAAPFGQLSTFFGASASPPPSGPATLADALAAFADDCHLFADGLIVTLVLAGLFANHFWRICCFVLALRARACARLSRSPAPISRACRGLRS